MIDSIPVEVIKTEHYKFRKCDYCTNTHWYVDGLPTGWVELTYQVGYNHKHHSEMCDVCSAKHGILKGNNVS